MPILPIAILPASQKVVRPVCGQPGSKEFPLYVQPPEVDVAKRPGSHKGMKMDGDNAMQVITRALVLCQGFNG